MWFSYAGYALVALLCYWAFAGYSLALLPQDLIGMFAMFLPLLVMAWVLRTTRALNLAMELGFATLLAIILLKTLGAGPSSLQEWLNALQARMQAMGMTEAQLLAMSSGQSLEQAARGLMLGWPFAFLLMQFAILLLARWWQAVVYYPGGFQTEFHQLRLHKAVALALAIVLLVLSFTGAKQIVVVQLATSAMLLLAIPGLAFTHWFVKFKGLNRWWLLLVYMAIFGTSFAAMPLLAMLAVLDSGLNLRLRLQKPQTKR
jgi:uncharacterized protein YybS (DUF2232 family)